MPTIETPENSRLLHQKYRPLYARINYAFTNPSLLKQALTYLPFRNQFSKENESIKYLEIDGDKIINDFLDTLLTSMNARRGKLPEELSHVDYTMLCHALRSNVYLMYCAASLELPQYMDFSRVHSSPDDKALRVRVLANTFEALVGAILRDETNPSRFQTTLKHLLFPYGFNSKALHMIGNLVSHSPNARLEGLQELTDDPTASIEYFDDTVSGKHVRYIKFTGKNFRAVYDQRGSRHIPAEKFATSFLVRFMCEHPEYLLALINKEQPRNTSHSQ